MKKAITLCTLLLTAHSCSAADAQNAKGKYEQALSSLKQLLANAKQTLATSTGLQEALEKTLAQAQKAAKEVPDKQTLAQRFAQTTSEYFEKFTKSIAALTEPLTNLLRASEESTKQIQAAEKEVSEATSNIEQLNKYLAEPPKASDVE